MGFEQNDVPTPSVPFKTPRQLTLGLSYRKAYNQDDFLVAPCNEEAVSWLDAYPAWPGHALVILGPKGSGKTHLSHIFSQTILDGAALKDIADLKDTAPQTTTFLPENVDKIVVENIDALSSEQALFHLFNWTKEQGIGLLMTARTLPAFGLPDLASRLTLAPKVTILPPDDELMYAVLLKAFHERNIAIDLSVIEYAVKQIERSFPAVHRLIDEADKVSLEKGRRITIPMVKDVLKNV